MSFWRPLAACSLLVLLTVNTGAAETPAPYPEPAARPAHWPAFSWDRVPLFAHLGKHEGAFNEEELAFLAENFSLICLEKSMEMKLPGNNAGAAINRGAGKLKEHNPNVKVLGYWNAFIAFPMYAAFTEFETNKGEWAIHNTDGSLYLKRKRVMCHDLSKPEVRQWWLKHAMTYLAPETQIDGLFIDALPAASHSTLRKDWGDEKAEGIEAGLWSMVRKLYEVHEGKRLLIYNGAGARLRRWEDRGLRFLEAFDGVMLEHFAGNSTRDRKTHALKVDDMRVDLEIIRKAAAMGKLVFVKGWPKTKPHLLDKEVAISEQQARDDLVFPLACFLLAAEENCYFLYNWGYTNKDGQYTLYDEYKKPLGPPSGPMQEVNSGILTRQFVHAEVWVDINTEEARIKWEKEIDSK